MNTLPNNEQNIASGVSLKSENYQKPIDCVGSIEDMTIFDFDPKGST